MSQSALAPTGQTSPTQANLASDLKPPGEAAAKVKVRTTHHLPIEHSSSLSIHRFRSSEVEAKIS
ncbi:MAG: hypothetical protein Q9215_007952 [Flavoplaca cf. flavocitrina]